MNTLTLQEYQRLVDKSVVLEQDRHGLKVLETDDGLIVKLFRQKRLLSSALLKSYASRFVANARALKALGVNTVEVENILYCKPIKRTLVIYQPIPGKTLREVLKIEASSDDIMYRFIVFLAGLHNKGVFFRSIHLSNIIVSDSLDIFGLIDFADMKILSKGLPIDMRLRNFRHLARYQCDQESIKRFGVERFMDIYFRETSLPEAEKKRFLAYFQKILEIKGHIN